MKIRKNVINTLEERVLHVMFIYIFAKAFLFFVGIDL